MKKYRFFLIKPESISKKILSVYLVIAVLTLFAVLFCLVFCDKIFPDYTTGMYWVNELMLLFDGLTSAFILPVLLFELMNICLGLKNRK